MKLIFTLFICLGFFSISSTIAQEETKKVIVIKKTVDENGQEISNREEASGKDADALIKKLKEDGSLEGIDIDIEIEKAKKKGTTSNTTSEDITIEKSIKNGKEVTTYKIETIENGEKKVMIWKGEEGDLPEEIAKKLKDIDIETERALDGEEIKVTVDAEAEEDTEIQSTQSVERRVTVRRTNENRVSLGVMINDDKKGVVLSDIIEGSVAENAGLKIGDTILKINDDYVFNTKMLLKSLSKFDIGDKIQITYLRDGKEKMTEGEF